MCLCCERKESSTQRFDNVTRIENWHKRNKDKIVGAGGKLRRIGKTLLYVMGGIAKGDWKDGRSNVIL